MLYLNKKILKDIMGHPIKVQFGLHECTAAL